MLLKQSPAFDDVFNSLNSDYEVLYATDELISVRFVSYTYGRGAAHSVQTFRVLNYDLKSNRTIKLSDLFKPGSKHLKFIADYCVGEFRRLNKMDCVQHARDGRDCEHVQDIWPAEYVKPTLENYQNWNVMDSGLLLSFDACLVAGCAAGEREVLIPYATLNHLLSAGSVVASMAKGPD